MTEGGKQTAEAELCGAMPGARHRFLDELALEDLVVPSRGRNREEVL